MSYKDPYPHHPHRPQRAGGGGVPDGLLIGALAFLLGLSLFAWTATGLSGLLSHGSWPDGVSFGRTPLAVRELVTDPRDLAGAWPDTPRGQLSGHGLFWGIFIGQLMVLIVLTIFVMGTVTRARAVREARRITRAQERERALEGPQEAQHEGQRGQRGAREGVGERAPETARGHEPTPPPTEQATPPAHPAPVPSPAPSPETPAADTPVPAPVPVPVPGASAEDHITRVLEAPGAALVASATPELWAATKTARAKLGPVHLFDPTHACDTPDRLRWSPHHGCADRETVAARATALLAPLRSPRPIDATTHTTAETVLRCWLHAAALEGRPFREVHRWALATAPATDPVRTLRTHPKAAPGAAGELESVLTGHPQLRADAVALIRRALAPLGQLHVRNACSAERADRLALESFVAETGTLYVVGEDPDVLPLLNALTQSVVEHGRRVAARSSAGRLDPPLTSVLNLGTERGPTA